ncbi:MAG TPA: type II toxin-antitoxin system HicB family antitoxin [Pirellulales bacterium]|jgi:predicted RNase H-like HicB family nuclease|nr:type II toxin-antitoxin system HicB family antitoxin [Pirellulales bacterium]
MYIAVIQESGDWWIGWIEEIPGVNSQGATRAELIENLQSALHEAFEINHARRLQ